MDIREVGRQAALAKAVELVGRVDMVEQDDVCQLADAAVVAALHRVTEAMTEKLTPALNTGTAFDLLIIVGQVIRELGAAFTPAEPQTPERGLPGKVDYLVPCGDAGSQMEWHRDGWDVEIVFDEHGRIVHALAEPAAPVSSSARPDRPQPSTTELPNGHLPAVSDIRRSGVGLPRPAQPVVADHAPGVDHHPASLERDHPVTANVLEPVVDARPARTLKDYRPQHDEACQSRGCLTCGHTIGFHGQILAVLDNPHAFESCPCSCGLDALLSGGAPAQEPK